MSNISQKKVNGSTNTIFADKPAIIVLTVLIAFLGGIPGIIAIIDYLKEKPDTKFQIGVVQLADFRDNVVRQNNSSFFLTCAIVNQGKKPLFPSDFKVVVRRDGQDIVLSSSTMPENLKTLTSDYKMVVKYHNTKENELVSLKKLSPDETFYGNFYSEISTPLRKSFTNSKECLVKVICIDIYGKKYESDFVVPPRRLVAGNYDIPKTGIEVRPSPFSKPN